MEEERLALLEAEIKQQMEKIEKIYEKIEERKENAKKSNIVLESLSYQLHNLYCAYEDLFKIVADFFENKIEKMPHYHTQLLRRMTLEIKGIRPALISYENFILLDELRAFRHLFRYAYLYELDPKKVEIVLEKALKLKVLFVKDIENFFKKLKL